VPELDYCATASRAVTSQTNVLGRWCIAASLLLVAASARGADRHPTPSIPWVLTQGIPSPQVAFGSGDAIFGLRWQVTPFLYSWGIHRSAPRRWRLFIVEPSMRLSGSFEIFGGPEWLRAERWFGRAGVRSYFPIAQRGEALAISLGTSAWSDGREVGPSFEVGTHVLFGLLAVLATYSAELPRAEWTLTLQVRVL
jgi:hypothetical protein